MLSERKTAEEMVEASDIPRLYLDDGFGLGLTHGAYVHVPDAIRIAEEYAAQEVADWKARAEAAEAEGARVTEALPSGWFPGRPNYARVALLVGQRDGYQAATEDAEAEVARLKAQLLQCHGSRSAIDCQYAGAWGETDGASHCPHAKPCQRCTLEREVDRLRELVALGLAVADDFMPNIGRCVLQDIGRLNTFLIQARREVAEVRHVE